MSFDAMQRRMIPRPILFVALAVMIWCAAAYAQPIDVAVQSSAANDTAFTGFPLTLQFTMNAGTVRIAGLQLPIVWTFSDGNIVGPLRDDAEVFYSAKTVDAFEAYGSNLAWGGDATDPDSTKMSAIDFDLAYWTGAGELWRITFTPSGTGTITLDTLSYVDTFVVAADTFFTKIYPEFVDEFADPVAVTWTPLRVTVVECPVALTGDVNQDGVITAADVIMTVLAVFKCDFGCIIPCWAAGDVNCNGSVTAADIVGLVNYVFKGGAPPCDVCPLILDGTWTCP